MFSSILRAKNGEIDVEKAEQNVKAINQALSETVKAKDYQKLKIKKHSFDVMCDLFPILSALEDGITLMGGEKYGTGSSVLPFLFMFNKLLEPKDEDRKYLCDVKAKIRSYLEEATKKNLNFDILAKASFLDKR